MATTVRKKGIMDFLGGAGKFAGDVAGGALKLRATWRDPYGAEQEQQTMHLRELEEIKQNLAMLEGDPQKQQEYLQEVASPFMQKYGPSIAKTLQQGRTGQAVETFGKLNRDVGYGGNPVEAESLYTGSTGRVKPSGGWSQNVVPQQPPNLSLGGQQNWLNPPQQENLFNQESGGRLGVLPGWWNLPETTDEDRQRYLRSRGGREFSSKPWSTEYLTEPETKKAAEMVAGFEPKAKSLPSEAITSLSVFQDLLVAVREAREKYKKGYVGFWEGGIKGKAKEITGKGLTSEEASFRRTVQSMIRRVYAESGKQISVQEMKLLEPFIPRLHQSDEYFDQNLTDFTKELEGMLSRRSATLTETGYKTPDLTRTNQTKTENVPTAEELRKQNTEEAYQKGVELGYWQ